MKSAKPLWLLLVLLGFAFPGLALTGCKEEKATVVEVKPATAYFPVQLGDKVVNLQIAALPQEQQMGLMHRRDLKADDGMVFVFPAPQRMSFYMRNTPTPLTIGYFDEAGVLREKYDMHPLDETPVPSRSTQIQFCVEMQQGWYDRNGVKPGAKLDLAAVAAAMQARGLDPVEFGLREFLPPRR